MAIIPRMHLLRTSSMLARLILAWVVMAVGAAVASPIVYPRAVQLVCGVGSAVKLVAVGEQGDPAPGPASHHTLDCPLCLHFGAPAPQEQAGPAVLSRLQGPAPWFAVGVASVAMAGAPLPPRGPPVLIA